MKTKRLFALLLSLVLCAALLPPGAFAGSAATPVEIGPGAADTQDNSKEISELIEYSERAHDMITRFAPKADTSDRMFGTARLIVFGEKEPDYTGSVAHVGGFGDRRLIQYPSAESAREAFERLNKDPGLRLVVPDAMVQTDRSDCEGDFNSWGYGYAYADEYTYERWLINNHPNSLPYITVGVIDTGVALNHPMFSGRLVQGYDFYNSDSNPSDDNGHGTHVAGIIADGTPGNVRIMPIKAGGSDGMLSSDAIFSSIEYARLQGCSVINMSFGLLREGAGDTGWVSQYNAYVEYIGACMDQDVICVGTSGNESTDAANHIPGGRVERVFTVASCNKNFAMSSFSNYGQYVDITAYGEDIFSANYQLSPALCKKSGTSMAAPHVAAACALVRSAYPYCDADAVVWMVQSACYDRGISGGGTGVLNIANLVRQLSRDSLPQPQSASSVNTALYSGGTLKFLSPGHYPVTTYSMDGDACVIAGNRGVANSVSLVTITLYLYEGSTLSYDIRYCTEANRDFVDTVVNGECLQHFSGNDPGWLSYRYTTPSAGYYTFTWRFTKDSSGNNGWDGFLLNNITWTGSISNINQYSSTPNVGYMVPLGEYANASGSSLFFTSMTNYQFKTATSGSRYCVSSGNKGVASSWSEISTALYLNAGEKLYFDVYCSTEANADYYYLYINGSLAQTLSGQQDWTTYCFTASGSGVYKFTWYYYKNSSGNSGSDCVMLDNIMKYSGGLLGDADANGVINANDALLVLRYSLGLTANISLTNADVDGNGVINANDALKILRYALGVGSF